MDYFYAFPKNISRDTVEIVGEEFTHLVHVMRKKEGDVLRVVDGKGTAYDVELSTIKKKTAVGKIIAQHLHHNEPDREITLAVGILKNPSKFDFLVEKVTELGVREIIPMSTARTIPHHTKSDRWQKLALAAMKQCGRSILPYIYELRSLNDVLASASSYTLAVVCSESIHPNKSLTALLNAQRAVLSAKNTPAILIMIGPEGGFSDEEVTACLHGGCIVASLGPRRLRTETAAICAASLVLQS